MNIHCHPIKTGPAGFKASMTGKMRNGLKTAEVIDG
jgi:hypothetical protein